MNKIIKNTSNRRNYLTLAICLFMTFILFGGWSFQYIDINVFKMAGMIVSLGMLLKTLSLSVSTNLFYNKYTNYIRGILFITILSMFCSYIFWGQSVMLAYRVTYLSLCISIFFLLLYYQISLSIIEKYIIIIALIYCFAWSVGFLTYPNSIFGSIRLEEDQAVTEETRGLIRLMVTGKSSLVLAFFLSLTKLAYGGEKKYLFLTIVFYVFIVLGITRQIIFLTLLIGLFFMFRNNIKVRFITILFAATVYFSGGINIKYEIPIISSLLELTETQFENNKNEEDIRIREYNYFLFNFTKDFGAVFFGNGISHTESSYGKYMEQKQWVGYYLSDVGYPQMYVYTGIFGLLLYVGLFLNCSIKRCDEKYMFAKLFMIYSVFANITAAWYNKIDYIVCLCICVYLIGNDHYKKVQI